MANLKLDLINKLNNDKFYSELELVRLAQEPNMNYKEKIELMNNQLEELALLNIKAGLIEEYFKEPVPTSQGAPLPQGAPVTAPAVNAPVTAKPTGKVHQGQSHGE
jgi:hypothetical protein